MNKCGSCGADITIFDARCPQCGATVEPLTTQSLEQRDNMPGEGQPPLDQGRESAQSPPAAGPGYPSAQPIVPGPAMPYQPPVRSGGGGRYFCENILGLIVFGLLALVALGLYGASSMGYYGMGLLGTSTAVMVPLVVGAVLTIRSKGLDVSLAMIMGLGGLVYSLSQSIITVLIACLVVGLLNGCLTVLLKLPAIISTLAVSSFLYGFLFIASMGSPVTFDYPVQTFHGVAAFISVAAGFCMVFFTALGKPFRNAAARDRGRWGLFLAYPVAAALAGVSGILQVCRIGAFHPTMAGTNYYCLLVFIWAGLYSSKLLDNRVAPVLYAVALLLVENIMKMAFNMIGVSAYWQSTMEGFLALLLLITAGFAAWPFKRQPDRPEVIHYPNR